MTSLKQVGHVLKTVYIFDKITFVKCATLK